MRHRRKVPFQPGFTLDPDIRGCIRRIWELDGLLDRLLLSESDYRRLVEEAYASNIHWSTRIEGNRLSLEEVEELTSGFSQQRLRESPVGPVQEILNHLRTFFLDRERLPWSIDTVLDVHRRLMTGVGQGEPGKIRDVPVGVYGSDGTERFIACPPGSVREELESLMDWLNANPFDEISMAALFFHEFESIHPFTDGNGRTGRTLFQMLLQEMGLKNFALCKFEEELLSDTSAYYGLLSYTDQTADYTPFVSYVAESVLIAYEKAYDGFSKKDRLSDFDEISKVLALRGRAAGRFTLADACSWATTVGEQSVRSRLDALAEASILRKEGRTRGMAYVFNDPFEELRRELRNG